MQTFQQKMLDQNKTLGLFLFLLGFVLGTLGVVMWFDKFFLCISNFFFLSGLYFIVGTKKITKFFFNRKKIMGTCFFFFGFFLIILGRTFLGFLCQSFGLYRMFFSFLPNIVNTVKYSPFSFILEIPGIKHAADYINNSKHLPLQCSGSIFSFIINHLYN